MFLSKLSSFLWGRFLFLAYHLCFLWKGRLFWVRVLRNCLVLAGLWSLCRGSLCLCLGSLVYFLWSRLFGDLFPWTPFPFFPSFPSWTSQFFAFPLRSWLPGFPRSWLWAPPWWVWLRAWGRVAAWPPFGCCPRSGMSRWRVCFAGRIRGLLFSGLPLCPLNVRSSLRLLRI